MDKPLIKADVSLSRLQLINFRCFSRYVINIDSPILLIEGDNGLGKTSILEALYYTCYLRSFRTHSPKELILFNAQEFFIKVDLKIGSDAFSHSIQIGFSSKKRLVKVDDKLIHSYKTLMTHYRVVSVTEMDLEIIQGAPVARRLFLDQTLMLLDPTYAQKLRVYRQVLDQRNALLQRVFNHEMYTILTEQLWAYAKEIELLRRDIVENIKEQMCLLSTIDIADDHYMEIDLRYKSRRILAENLEDFYQKNPQLLEQERHFRRTLFGPHLDDLTILLQGKVGRTYASRGQQKHMVILFKMAQLNLLKNQGHSGICLLDDFLTDFDFSRAIMLINRLSGLGTQLIFTSPLTAGKLSQELKSRGAQSIKLTE